MAVAYRSVILTPPDLDFPGWLPALAEAGCNTILLHAATAQGIDALTSWFAGPAGAAFTRQCARHHLLIETQLHTASWLLPRQLFSGSPELFCMTQAGARSQDANFCFRSAAAWELASRRIVELQRLLPCQTNRYLWFSDDLQDAACHCPECAPLTASDQALVYANQLA